MSEIITTKLLSQFKCLQHGFIPNRQNYNILDYQSNVNLLLATTGSKLVRPASQPHGADVFEVITGDESTLECDALVTNKKHVAIAVSTADCVPLLMYSKRNNYVAVVHAGWRSLYSGVIFNTVQKMINLGGIANEMYVAIGPHISVQNYNVNRDFIAHFTNNSSQYNDCVANMNGSLFFDLSKVAITQLRSCGIGEIEDVKICTFDSTIFPSFRRMQQVGGDTGIRFFSFIILK